MKSQKVIGTLTALVMILITCVVVVGLVTSGAKYSAALEAVSAGNYSYAKEQLEELDYGYRDREALLNYIEVMQEYDPADMETVYRSYRTVNTLCEADVDSNISAMFSATLQSISISYYSMFVQANGLG